MDRNYPVCQFACFGWLSLSARRAWIEIRACITTITIYTVALRKESVDRNFRCDVSLNYKEVSLSARRAWIEIIMFVNLRVLDGVALRKESVDRNYGPFC